MTLYSSRSPYKDEVQYPTLSSSSIGRPAVWTPQCCRQRAASPSDQVSGVNMSPELPCDPHASLPPEKEMAPRPKKPLTLAQIRAEGTAFRAAAMPAAKGSAFYALTQKNNAFLNGTTRRDEFNRKRNDDDDVCSPAAKKTFKTPTRTTKRRKVSKKQVTKKTEVARIPPKPQIVESWQTAAGYMVGDEESALPTPFLGIARVPTWREDKFKKALRALLDPVGGAEAISAISHEAGGEYYSEITACFLNEEIAGKVLEEINGAMCLGRKLQVAFATNS